MNEKKKILLISSAFCPEISPRSFRATELAKEFCRQGHDVTVISKFRDYDYSDFLKEFPVKLKMWSKPLFPRIPVIRQKHLSFLTRGISRLLSILFEYPGIEEIFKIRNILKQESGYDLMISFAVPYPVHWGVASARSPKKPIARTWVADCGDPYMFGRLDTFRKPFYFRFPEINFCQKCDYITIPVNEMQTQFYSQFSSKIRVIPQGLDFGAIRLNEGPPENSKPVFVFAGSVIPGKRDLSMFFDFLVTLQTDYLFIVYTNQKEWFNRYKQVLRDKLDIRGYIDRIALIYEMSKADFLVNVDTVFEKSSHIEAVPSKLIDYALSNRPILNINSASLNKGMVMKFMNKDYSMQRVIEKSRYDIRKVSKQFLELIR